MSYITTAEADEYFTTRLKSEAWTTAVDVGTCDAALHMASTFLDAQAYTGTITASAQPHAWPRKGIRDQEGRSVASSEIPLAIRSACAEMALHLLTVPNATTGTVTPSIRRKRVGDLEVEYANPQMSDPMPAPVRNFLQPYLKTALNSACIVLG
jgi:hypothetical protein